MARRRISLEGWEYGGDALEALDRHITRYVENCLTEVVLGKNGLDPFPYFPAASSEPRGGNDEQFTAADARKALVVHVTPSVEDFANDGIVLMKFDLAKAFELDLKICADDGSNAGGLALVSGALKRLAARIDRAVALARSAEAKEDVRNGTKKVQP